MKGRITEIRYGEGGKVLTVVVGEPFDPYRPPNFHTEEDAEAYEKAKKEYQRLTNIYEHLRLGFITFEYDDAPK